MESNFEQQIQERAVLVGLNADCFSKEQTATDETLEELEALLETAGGFCTGKVLQNRHTPDSHSFIGEGKAQEVKMLVEATASTMVIFDNELSPGNIRALEEIIGVTVPKPRKAACRWSWLNINTCCRDSPVWAQAFPGRAAASVPGAPVRQSWSLTGGISVSALPAFSRSWSRCVRSGLCSGNAG